jgi:hypothetical protein
MVHPLHGATHAYDNSEIERLKGLGWSVEEPKTAQSLPVAGYIDVLRAQRNKPGRPPKVK